MKVVPLFSLQKLGRIFCPTLITKIVNISGSTHPFFTKQEPLDSQLDKKSFQYIIEMFSTTFRNSPESLVVVQCDGSQGDSYGKYEQQFPSTPSTPLIIISAPVQLLSNIGISQFKLCSITVDVVFSRWIAATVGTGTLSSGDRVITIGIL